MEKPARPRGRRTLDMPSGREALLSAAVRLFAAQGYQRTDIRSVAAAAGVGANLVRVHFGGKAELWTASAERILARATPMIEAVSQISSDPSLTLKDRLSIIIQKTVDFYRDNPETRDFAFRCVAEGGEQAELITRNLLVPAYEAGRATFQQAIESGLIRSRNPAIFFIILTSILSQPNGFPDILSKIAPEIRKEEAYSQLAISVIDALIHKN
jgi:TetR/AcrR family transcriptional regulator